MNQKKLLLTLSCLIGLAGSASADWTLLNNFNDPSDADRVTNILTFDDSGAGGFVEDGVLSCKPGALYDQTSNAWILLDLGVDLQAASVAVDGPITMYFEMIHPIVPYGDEGLTRQAIADVAMGFCHSEPATILVDRYDSLNASMRINSGNINWEPRNGGSYIPQGVLTPDVTHSLWMVCDFVYNYFEIYIQGGAWTDQTGIDASVELGNSWSFRVNPDDGVNVHNFLVALSRGNSVAGEKGKDPFYFDNFYYDATGANLTLPPIEGEVYGPGIFGSYVVVSDEGGNRWVDTGSWMGWVNVEYMMAAATDDGFAYILDLDTWAYAVAGASDAVGGWLYVYK